MTTTKINSRKAGSAFEEQFEDSCKHLGIFFHRNRDVFIPPDLRMRVRVPKNLYDYFMFYGQHLFALELKSTKEKSLSLSESVIKPHQIQALIDAQKYDNIIAGFLVNFRECDNKTYFVPIESFILYQEIGQGLKPNTLKGKVNRASIPIATCEEIGFELGNFKKKVKYHYHVRDLADKLLTVF